MPRKILRPHRGGVQWHRNITGFDGDNSKSSSSSFSIPWSASTHLHHQQQVVPLYRLANASHFSVYADMEEVGGSKRRVESSGESGGKEREEQLNPEKKVRRRYHEEHERQARPSFPRKLDSGCGSQHDVRTLPNEVA